MPLCITGARMTSSRFRPSCAGKRTDNKRGECSPRPGTGPGERYKLLIVLANISLTAARARAFPVAFRRSRMWRTGAYVSRCRFGDTSAARTR
jgi:hypothetical protein